MFGDREVTVFPHERVLELEDLRLVQLFSGPPNVARTHPLQRQALCLTFSICGLQFPGCRAAANLKALFPFTPPPPPHGNDCPQPKQRVPRVNLFLGNRIKKWPES